MKKLLFIIITFASIPLFAQKSEPVTITVCGKGSSKLEAQNIALRNAIEQAFGTYISSKTEILNDKLTKDEIVTITNGSVEAFKVISETTLPDNNYAVTLTATLSVTKLTEMCTSKGIEVEVKGSALVANIRLQQLNEEAEYKAILNLCNISWDILSKSVDFKLEVGNPEISKEDADNYILPMAVKYETNKNRDLFAIYFINSLRIISMKEEDYRLYNSLKKPVEYIVINSNLPIKLRNPKSALAIKNLVIKANRFLFDFLITSEVDSVSLITNLKNNSREVYNSFGDCMPIIEAGYCPYGYSQSSINNIYYPGISVAYYILKNSNYLSELTPKNLFSVYMESIRAIQENQLYLWYYNKNLSTEASIENVTYFIFNQRPKSTGLINLRHKIHINNLEKISKYTINNSFK